MTAESSNSAVSSADYVGKTGRLLVGFGPGATGKIRLEVKGSTIDLLCTSMDDGTYESRDEVIVVEMDGARARVAKTRISAP
jgi:membrane protein implicated in regulation of membrane protease activity